MSSLQYTNEEGYGTTSATSFHYSQAVTIGNIVKLSGQGGWNAYGKFEDETVKEHIARAFDNVEKVLKAAGLKGWEDVYLVRTYHTDIDVTLQITADIKKDRCPNHMPLWTAIGVKKLGIPEMIIEVEVEAYKA